MGWGQGERQARTRPEESGRPESRSVFGGEEWYHVLGEVSSDHILKGVNGKPKGLAGILWI